MTRCIHDKKLCHLFEYSKKMICCISFSFFFFLAQSIAFGQDIQKICAGGSGEAAMNACNQIIKLNPKNAIAFFNRGLLWSKQDSGDRAIADFNEAIKINPSFAEAYYERGLWWLDKMQWDKALSDFNMAIRFMPGFADAYLSRGSFYQMDNQLEKALKDFNEALRLEPSSEAFYQRGVTWAKNKQHDKAVVDFNEALKLAKSPSGKIYHERALALEAIGNIKAAINDASSALQVEPNSKWFHDTLMRLKAIH